MKDPAPCWAVGTREAFCRKYLLAARACVATSVFRVSAINLLALRSLASSPLARRVHSFSEHQLYPLILSMPSFFLTSAIAATIISSASAQFNPTGKTNVVTYWGQGPNQARLVETCKNSGEKAGAENLDKVLTWGNSR